MAKHVLSLFIKLALFTVIMLFVAKEVPYDGLVDTITALFDFQSALNVTHFILGEPDLEAWESLRDYFSILINTLISIPVMSAIITLFNGLTHKVTPSCLPKEWAFSTVRRLIKIIIFVMLLWLFVRFVPYQAVFPDIEKFSDVAMAALMAFNLILAIFCYYFIMKKCTFKRSL